MFIVFNKDYTFNCFSETQGEELFVEISSKEYTELKNILELKKYSLFYNIDQKNYCITREPFPNSIWDGKKFVNYKLEANTYFKDKINKLFKKTKEDFNTINFILKNERIFYINGKISFNNIDFTKEELVKISLFLKAKMLLINSSLKVKEYQKIKSILRNNFFDTQNNFFKNKEKISLEEYQIIKNNFFKELKKQKNCFCFKNVKTIIPTAFHFGINPKVLNNEKKYKNEQVFFQIISKNDFNTPILIKNKKGIDCVLEGNHRVSILKKYNLDINIPVFILNNIKVNKKDFSLLIPKSTLQIFEKFIIFRLGEITEEKNLVKIVFKFNLINYYGVQSFFRDLFIIIDNVLLLI